VRCTCRTHARSRADEVLIQVAASGVGYWEDVVRSGDWDLGGALPMAVGVETAGTVTAVGSEVMVFGVGDEVLTRCVPLREQGAWAEQVICAAADCAGKPPGVAWSDAAVFPVPALTAAQVVDDALAVQPGETLLAHGAGGVTGRLIVQLAVVRGARVIATAGPASAEAVRAVGAAEVVDYHDARWPERVRGTRGRVVWLSTRSTCGPTVRGLPPSPNCSPAVSSPWKSAPGSRWSRHPTRSTWHDPAGTERQRWCIPSRCDRWVVAVGHGLRSPAAGTVEP
jgi:NADPH:quinone reductase-like Zn-dependent oxidoreductase